MFVVRLERLFLWLTFSTAWLPPGCRLEQRAFPDSDQNASASIPIHWNPVLKTH